MSDLYNAVSALCEQHEITVYKMCKDIGIRGSILSDLNTGRKRGLSTDTLSKIANYFEVSIDALTGRDSAKEKTPTLTKKDARDISDDDIKFALFGDKTIDDETYESVKNFAKFAAEQKRKRKEGEQ